MNKISTILISGLFALVACGGEQMLFDEPTRLEAALATQPWIPGTTPLPSPLLVSRGGGCGDGTCEASESHTTCPADCAYPASYKLVGMDGRFVGYSSVAWSGRQPGTVWAEAVIPTYLPDQIWVRVHFNFGTYQKGNWQLFYQHDRPIKRIITAGESTAYVGPNSWSTTLFGGGFAEVKASPAGSAFTSFLCFDRGDQVSCGANISALMIEEG